MPQNIPFGAWLKHYRKNHDLTQQDLAELVGCSISTIAKIEAGERRLSRHIAERLATLLELSPDERNALIRAARNIPATPPPPLLSSTPPAAAAPAAPLRNLPTPLTPLIGRTEELVAIERCMQRSTTRMLTLTGPPGIGKTRMAIQITHDLAGSFRDGVVFVALATIRDPDMVLPTIAQTLGITEGGSFAILPQLQKFLANKQMLLTLDNIEQVIAAAPALAELLTAAPDVKLMITSRVVLRIYGEHVWVVSPLSLPNLKNLPPLDELSCYSSVALFVQRLQAFNPLFCLTETNAPLVAEICVRLDGLPLAIELAAARSKLLPLPALLSRLTHRLTLLTGGGRNLPAHQQTLRGTLDWSYHLLSPAEQRLFTRLGIFVGGCGLDAATAVCNGPDDLAIEILDGLSALIDQHLLQLAAGVESEPRFMMLETIREYALEQLKQSGEIAIIRQRHCQFYLSLVESTTTTSLGPHNRHCFNQLDLEHDNLRAALTWALEQRETEIADRLSTALGWLWERQLGAVWV